VGRQGAIDLGCELHVRAAHVLETARHHPWSGLGFLVGARHDIDQNLQRGVETVEKSPERGEPAPAIVLRRPGEPDRARLDDRKA
jgi:hypothetical protein